MRSAECGQNGSFYSIEMVQYLCPKLVAPLISDNGVSWYRARFLYRLKCILKWGTWSTCQ